MTQEAVHRIVGALAIYPEIFPGIKSRQIQGADLQELVPNLDQQDLRVVLDAVEKNATLTEAAIDINSYLVAQYGAPPLP